MKKKLKLKSSVYYVLIIVIVGIFLAYFGIKKYKEYKYHQTNEYKLTTIGYTLEDAKKIIFNLTDDDVSYILTINKDDRILQLLDQKYFIKKNFRDYYDYVLANKKMEISEVIPIINCKVNNEYYSLDLETDMSKEDQIIVNKYYHMSSDYSPTDLVKVSMDYSWGDYGSVVVRQVVMDNFLNMWQAANNDGIYLMISSAYRSYQEQEIVYNNYKDSYGEDYANSIAAKPGFSEHQTGLAIDIFSKTNSNRKTFEDSEAAKWLFDNAYRFGFILRYPKDKVKYTGYAYESWHYRYVGKEIAEYIHNNDITYEEYYAYFLDN